MLGYHRDGFRTVPRISSTTHAHPSSDPNAYGGKSHQSKVVPMSVAPMKVARMRWRKGGCQSCRNSRTQVTENTQIAMRFTARSDGQTKNAARIQNTSYNAPAPWSLSQESRGASNFDAKPAGTMAIKLASVQMRREFIPPQIVLWCLRTLLANYSSELCVSSASWRY